MSGAVIAIVEHAPGQRRRFYVGATKPADVRRILSAHFHIMDQSEQFSVVSLTPTAPLEGAEDGEVRDLEPNSAQERPDRSPASVRSTKRGAKHKRRA
ncbi:MAG: hypothetical protein ACTHU0_21865 [Kofleriaceae bacterium]